MAKSVKQFGENLRRIRETHGLTQEGLALSVGLDRTYIGGIERGERNPSLKVILRLAESFDISPEEFFR